MYLGIHPSLSSSPLHPKLCTIKNVLKSKTARTYFVCRKKGNKQPWKDSPKTNSKAKASSVSDLADKFNKGSTNRYGDSSYDQDSYSASIFEQIKELASFWAMVMLNNDNANKYNAWQC